MNWYYAENNQQRGPVSEDEMKRLVADGTVTPQTLVWHEGLANWAPCSTVAAQFSSGAEVEPAGVPVIPAMMRHEQISDPHELARRIDEHGYDFTIGSIIGRAWELVKGNLWPCIGVTLLGYLIIGGSQNIPFIGLLAVFLVQPQMQAGLYWYFLKQFRSGQAELNDSFDGFRRGFGQQAVYMLIVCGIMLAVLLPAGMLAALGGHASHGSAVIKILLGAIILIAGLIAWYFMVCWVFVPLLILDKGLKATEAMRLSRHAVHVRFWKIFGLMLVLGIFSVAGLMALIVGVFFVAPVLIASMTRLYEDIFGTSGNGAPHTQP
jgi:hypothetical protein